MSLLELFEGKITLEALQKMDLPKIYQLRDAKLQIIQEKQKLQKKMEEQAKRDSKKM